MLAESQSSRSLLWVHAMTLYLFNYCLPLLLGYTLFIGIAGRMNPFARPDYPEERPAWVLGLWTALATMLVSGAGLHMVDSLSLEAARAILPSSALTLTVLLLPGFAAYSVYRRHVTQQLRSVSEPAKHGALHQRLERDACWREHADTARKITSDTAMVDDTTSLPSGQTGDIPALPDHVETAPIVAAFMDSADLQTVDSREEAANGRHDNEPVFEAELDMDFVQEEQSLQDFLDETLFDDCPFDDIDEIQATEQETDSAESLMDQTVAFSDLGDTADVSHHSMDVDMGEAQETRILIEDTAGRPRLVSGSCTESETPVDNVIDTSDLAQRLSDETRAHEQTQRQLQVARRLLARLAPDSAADNPADDSANRGDTSTTRSEIDAHSDADTQPNTRLANQSLLDEERSRRERAEDTCERLQRELVNAKADIRRSMSARAKALSTANKAIGFARQTIRVRALLEEELALARNTLTQRQETISSVIRELESVRERTDEKTASLAREMMIGNNMPATTAGRESANEPLQHHGDDALRVRPMGATPETVARHCDDMNEQKNADIGRQSSQRHQSEDDKRTT